MTPETFSPRRCQTSTQGYHQTSAGVGLGTVELASTIQGMVDGSASKPGLRQDTGYMVEKTYLDIAPYLGAFGAYLMPQ